MFTVLSDIFSLCIVMEYYDSITSNMVCGVYDVPSIVIRGSCPEREMYDKKGEYSQSSGDEI